MTKPRVLFFDIETLCLKARIWNCGKQYITHKQLLHNYEMHDLICIQYAWEGEDVKVLRYDKHGGTKGIIEKFDKLVRQADYCIGKNSDRFDVKMINALRMFHNLPGIPEWGDYCDDLEKQMRRHFRLPSQSLDYISKQLGIGGKDKMEFADWEKIQDYRELTSIAEAIQGHMRDSKGLRILSHKLYGKSPAEVKREGKKALDKMCEYGKKDTKDTMLLWEYLKTHFKPKLNRSLFEGHGIGCKLCGSENVKKNGTRISGKTKYQYFMCNDCGYTATRSPIGSTGKLGKSG